MNVIHLVMTGKGGVGKSLISTLLAQYINKTTGMPFCADTDPSNPTFASYPAFQAKHIDIMTPEMNINKRRFDELMDELLSAETDCVVDNGSSSFLPLMAYFIENNVIEHLCEAGKVVIIHAVLVGGLGLEETQRGIETLLKAQVAPLVIWENEKYGPVEKKGKRFKDSNVYSEYEHRILGVVRIAQRGSDTYGEDMHIMTSNRMTFDDVMTSSLFLTFARQRMLTVQRDIDKQLDEIAFVEA
jgi:hypothetical protein